MSLDNEQLSNQLPYYLTRERKEGIELAIKEFNREPHADYYLDAYETETLQGDGWTGFCAIDFDTLDKKAISGIVLSNTCDVTPDNPRTRPLNLLFAPIVPLQNFLSFLTELGASEQSVDDYADQILNQRVSNIFYLPACHSLPTPHVAILDDARSMPPSAFNQVENRKKLFTLNDFGFYFFIFKLSIHFCRLHENVDRSKAFDK